MSKRNKNKNKPKIEVKELKASINNGPIELRFSPTAWAKLLYMRDVGKTEVGGFGVAPIDDLLYVQDFILPKQECSVASVEFNDESVADMVDNMVDRGYQPKQFMRIWIHTHPNMSAHPSGTDEQTFSRVFGDCDWAIMAILSKSGEEYCRISINGGPLPCSFEIPMVIDFKTYEFAASDTAAWLQEHTDNVKEASSWFSSWEQYRNKFKNKSFNYKNDGIASLYGYFEDDDMYDIIPMDQSDYNFDDSDFEIDISSGDMTNQEVMELLDANQLSLLQNMSEHDRQYFLDHLKEKLKIGD